MSTAIAKKYNACLPSSMHLAVQAEVAAESKIILEGLERTIAADDLLGTLHFCKRLKRFLRCKYAIPLHHKERIVSLVLPKITDPQMLWDKGQYLASIISNLVNPKKDKLNIAVDWRPMHDLVERIIFPGGRDALARPFHDEYGYRLRDLVLALRPSFPPAAVSEILMEVRPWLCPHTNTIYRAMGYLSLFLPISEDHDHSWLPEVLGVWCTVINTPFWDGIVLSLLSRLAQDKPHTVNWMPHLPFIFGQLLRAFDLPVGRGGLSSVYSHSSSSTLEALFGSSGKGKSASQSAATMKLAARFIVWILDGPQDESPAVFAHLQQLTRSIEGFYHPTTVHDRANALGSFLVSMAKEMVNRIKKEVQKEFPDNWRLKQSTKDAFVEMWTPIVLTTMNSKSRTLLRNASSALEYLALLSPQKLLPDLLQRATLVFSLAGTPGLKITMLEAFKDLVRPLLKYDTTGQYLAELLPHIVDGIDPNDPMKAKSALTLLAALSSQMVFAEQGYGERVCLQYAMEDFVVAVITKSLELFNSLSSSAEILLKANPASGFTLTVSRMAFESFFQALSQPLLLRCAKHMFQAFCGSIHSTTKLIGTLTQALCAANPEAVLKVYIPGIHATLVNDGQLRADVTDKELSWNVGVLGSLCVRAGPALLKYEDVICNIIDGLWTSTSKAQVKVGGRLLKRVLYCLTLTYPKDSRLVTRNVWDSSDFQSNHVQYWGHRCTVEESEVAWHVPSLAEVQLAVRLFNRCYASSSQALESALAGESTTAIQAVHNDDDLSHVNRCRLALKQIKKLVASGATLLDALPDTWAAPTSAPFARFNCNMVSSLDFGGENPLAELKYSRQDICGLICKVIEKFSHNPDVDVLSKSCKIIHCALMGVGMGSMKASRSHALEQTLKYLKSISTGEKVQARNYHVLRTHLLLCQRASPRSFTAHSNIHSQCHQMLMLLTTGPYAEVRKAAQRVLREILPSAPYGAQKEILRDTIRGLTTAKDADQMMGVVQLLKDSWASKKFSKDLELVALFMEQACQAKEFHDEPTLRGKVEGLHDHFRGGFRGIHVLGDPKQPAVQQLQQYNALFERLVQLSRNPDLKWQSQLMIIYNVRLLLAYLPVGFPDYRLPDSVLEYCLRMPLQEQPMIRRAAMHALGILLKLLRPVLRRLTLPGTAFSPSHSNYFTPEDIAQLNSMPPTSDEEYSKAHFVDKMSFGYCALPQSIAVIDYSTIEPCNQEAGGVSSQYSDFRTLVAKTMNSDYMVRLVDLLFIDKSASHGLDDCSAQVFKGLFQIVGIDLYSSLSQCLERHIDTAIQASRAKGNDTEAEAAHDEKAHFGVVVDVLAGFIRATRLWSFADTQQAWSTVTSILQTVVEKASPAGYTVFLSLLYWAAYNMDPRRCVTLKQLLLKWLREQNEDAAGYAITVHHRVLQSVITASAELAWKDSPFQTEVLAAMQPQLQSAYQQVRGDIGSLLSAIYSYKYRSARSGYFTTTADIPDPDLVAVLQNAIAVISSDDAEAAQRVTKMVLNTFSKSHGNGGTHPMQPYCCQFLVAVIEGFNRWYDETDAPFAALLNTVIMQMAAISYSEDVLPKMIGVVCCAMSCSQTLPVELPMVTSPVPEVDAALQSTQAVAWRARHALLKFLQTFMFRNQFGITAGGWVGGLLHRICGCLFDSRVEVQDEAVHTLALFTQLAAAPETIQQLQSVFLSWCNKAVPRGIGPGAAEVVIRQAGCLGLMGILKAFPHTVPSVTPLILSKLARHVNDPYNIGTRVRKTFGEWWKAHQDMWEISYKAQFTEDQLEAIGEVVYSPTYYA